MIFSILVHILFTEFFQEKDDSQRKKKESIVDLSRFMDKRVRVKFQGGREGANCCIP